MNIETANKLVELRKKHNLSQEDLANKLGLSRQAVSKWERAEAAPDTDNLIKLARLYKISLDELLLSDVELIKEIDKELEDNEKPKSGDDKIYDVDTESNDVKVVVFKRSSRAIISTICLIGFFLFGFLTSKWYVAWLFFLGVPLLNSIVLAIKAKKLRYFNYTIFVTIIFFILGFYFDLWAYAWILFLTPPIFHNLVGSSRKVIYIK